MTGFEADQGFVNCGDAYVALDIEAIPGLGDKLEMLRDLLVQRHKGADFTLSDLTNHFVRRAVECLDVDNMVAPLPPESQDSANIGMVA